MTHCSCDDPDREEIKRNVYICMKCNKELEPMEPVDIDYPDDDDS